MITQLHVVICLLFAVPITSFLLPPTTCAITRPTSIRTSSALAASVSKKKKDSPEYSVVEPEKKTEFAALSPGCSVEIQVGDVSQARKAWKKRRRSGSPLLVPCSILTVDRKKMIRMNILHLVQKFGKPLSQIESQEVGFHSSDICLSFGDINKLYSSHFRTSLAKHAKELGHDSARSLVRDLFNRRMQKAVGVRLWLSPKDEHSNGEEKRAMWLMAPISKQRAHSMASQAGLLQFESIFNNDTEESKNDNNRIPHTGVLRIRNPNKKKPSHLLKPLSAALRVSQRELDRGMIQNGSKLNAIVFSFDQMGDGGFPLMTFSLHRTRGQVIDRQKLKAAGNRHFSQEQRVEFVGDVNMNFKDLKVGDGPYKAKVARLSTRSGAAFVDIGVGRTNKEGNTRVFGMLRFDDLVESAMEHKDESVVFTKSMSDDEAQLIEDSIYDAEEEWDEDDEDDDVMTVDDLMFFADEDIDEEDLEEDEDVDITDLMTVNEDGIVSYQDPGTGKTVIVSEMDVGSPADDDEGYIDSMFNGLSPEERLALLAKVVKDDVEHSHEDEGEEEEMDITHLISTADGVMSYKDPETGESVVISDDSIDDDELIDDEDDDEEDLLKNMSPEERLEMISKIMNDKQGDAAAVVLDHLEETEDMDDEADAKKPMTAPFASFDSSQPAIVQVGDEVEVYIKSVYKQSGRFMVTLDPSVQGRKPKDMKRESDVEKKLARLAEKGWNFDRIDELKGTECDGVVQAISNTGDWCYVKAALEDLPVGVANLSPDLSVSKGDSVHVRIDGIDESRGQIAMTVI